MGSTVFGGNMLTDKPGWVCFLIPLQKQDFVTLRVQMLLGFMCEYEKEQGSVYKSD